MADTWDSNEEFLFTNLDPENDRYVAPVEAGSYTGYTGDNTAIGYDPGAFGGDSSTTITPPITEVNPNAWRDILFGGFDTETTTGYTGEPTILGSYFDPYSVGYGFNPSTAGGSYDAWMGNPDVLKYAKDALDKPENTGKTLGSIVKGLFDKAVSSGLLGRAAASTLGALAALKFDKLPPSGGGYTKAYRGYTPTDTRTIVNTKHGPVVQYFKNPSGIGSLPTPVQPTTPNTSSSPTPNQNTDQEDKTNRFAQGGPVRLEDGGFVMTKRAVDGAGGPQGIQSLVPGAKMIRGPGTGTSDSIPAFIDSSKGTTPAAVSNGEAYLDKRATQQNGGASQLYALMNNLQRRG